MKISWIGCGNMGRPMATNLIKGGHEVTVFDVSKDNTEIMKKNGAAVASSPKEAAMESEVIFTMLPNGKILENVVLDEETGLLNSLDNGKMLVDMSTVAPQESEVIGKELAKKGTAFLRSPVTGSTVLAEQRRLGIFASGPKDAFEKVMPLFELMGNNFHYLGESEQARVLKLAINLILAANMQMLGEAVLLIDKSGLDRKQALDIIAESAAGSPVIGYKRDNVVNKDYTAAFSVAMMEKDLDLALAAAKAYKVGIPFTGMMRQTYSTIESAGRSSEDFSCLVDFMEKSAGIK